MQHYNYEEIAWCSMEIQKDLIVLSDAGYREFQARLIPTVDEEKILGVRMPQLRRYAKTLSSEQTELFLSVLPHNYYEENCLHGLLIEQIYDFDACVVALRRFLPYVDNWATCDIISPRIFAQNKAALLPVMKAGLTEKSVYAVRFWLRMLMIYFLKDDFQASFFDWVAAVQRGDYYLYMMVAWYFATALAYQPERAFAFLSTDQLDARTRRKAIQKALESNRVSLELKEKLRALRAEIGLCAQEEC